MDITVSVISHGHGDDVRALLGQLAELREATPRRVIVTLNVVEPGLSQALRASAWPFDLLLVDNPHPLGFGANHNQAFKLDGEQSPSSLFAVLNPDIRWRTNPFPAMLPLMAAGPRVGLVYPVQLGADGRRQDSERQVPTPWSLWQRYRPGGRKQEISEDGSPEWVNAAFALLRRDAFASIGGFDEAYHMYCEDVDLCLRLQLAGWHLARADQAIVEHMGQRASRRDPQHLFWHLSSLWRFWRSQTWRSWKRRQAGERGSTD